MSILFEFFFFFQEEEDNPESYGEEDSRLNELQFSSFLIIFRSTGGLN